MISMHHPYFNGKGIKYPYNREVNDTTALKYAALNNRINKQLFSYEKEVPMTISKELLDILACPKCIGDIRINESESGLICDTCKLLYHIKDGIPIMLIDEAEKIEK